MVAELVGVTLGPKGRNVVLQNKYGPPKIVNDGETVLKQVLINLSNLTLLGFLIFGLLFLTGSVFHPLLRLSWRTLWRMLE